MLWIHVIDAICLLPLYSFLTFSIVGSFVWTHLTNIQESQSLSPYKLALKDLIGQDFLQNKWKTDVRKFSRYFESSYFAKDLNAGATVDGQLVFSQDSYLPRSAMINLTANVFGENLHLLEVGARADGFEDLFESLFGPEGYFREDSLKQLLQTLRQKRHTSTISDFQQTFNQEDFSPLPRGNMYMRMFGRDFYYNSFEGLPHLWSRLSSTWPMSWLSGQDSQFSRSSVFLDGKISVPTVAGWPLDLAVNGTSTTSFKSKTTMDIANLFQTGDAHASIQFYPTASVLITGTMTVNAKYARSGLKSVSKLHTSTFVDAEAVVQRGKLIKAEVNLPRDKMEVIDISVDFLSLKDDDQYLPLSTPNLPKTYEGCTSETFNKFLGLKMCGQALYHENPKDELDLYFAGPISFKLGMTKIDIFDKFTFDYEWTQDEPTQAQLIVILDTPGSMINRRSSVNLSLDPKTLTSMSLDVEIPVKDVKINAMYLWTSLEKVLKASFNMENREVLSLHQSLKVQDEGRETDGKMLVKYQQDELIHWTGSLTRSMTKMDLSTSLDSIYLPRPMSGSFNLHNRADQWDLSGQIQSHWINVDSKGLFQQTDTSFRIKSDLSYNIIGSRRSQSLSLQCSYKLNRIGQLDKHLFNVMLDVSKILKRHPKT